MIFATKSKARVFARATLMAAVLAVAGTSASFAYTPARDVPPASVTEAKDAAQHENVAADHAAKKEKHNHVKPAATTVEKTDQKTPAAAAK